MLQFTVENVSDEDANKARHKKRHRSSWVHF